MNLSTYETDHFFDEMKRNDGSVREPYREVYRGLSNTTDKALKHRQEIAESLFLNMGVTFNVYSESQGVEKIFPFDVIPRVIDNREWEKIEKGLKQRVHALNLFINDAYNDQKIIKDRVISKEIVLSSQDYLKECKGVKPPKGIWNHISGIDLIRHDDGEYYILEDNLRVPSGVSYVLQNREVMKRIFPELFETLQVEPVIDYPLKLREMLQFISGKSDPLACVLTPGIYNSAYFEHSFLAKQMGIELVEGSDLVVKNDHVYMRTTKGLREVDVIYRRIDDVFLDPLSFNPSSVIGIPGIFESYVKGNIGIANAPGTGVADDKVICAYVPDFIKYYLGEEPILQNVPTFLCSREKDKKYVLENLDKMVVKAANQSGGYGMLMGPTATKKEKKEFADKIKKHPRMYIAQPVMGLSKVPTLVDGKIEGRHVDLRPFVIYGEDIYVMPGGLTRVALRKGSLVVNSSQGGGSKDTWVANTK
jgi:uncharacterized circularly permuted ATP-grasp superfamily protein